MIPHILQYKKIHKCAMSRANELIIVDDEIGAIDNQLVILLLVTLTWRCRHAHKVVWGRH